MNNLVLDHPGPDKRSFALPSLAEDDVEERSQLDVDTTFFTHEVITLCDCDGIDNIQFVVNKI